MSSVRRLQLIYEGKQREWEVVHKQLEAIRQAKQIETDPSSRFKFEHQIAAVEEELSLLEQELKQIEQQLAVKVEDRSASKPSESPLSAEPQYRVDNASRYQSSNSSALENHSFDIFKSNLDSEEGVNVDYSLLENLLKTGRWKLADQETLNLMLKTVHREQQRWLRVEDFVKFPCEDLQTINHLWQEYSSRRFGLAVQKKIWTSVKLSADKGKAIRDFCRVCGFAEQRGGLVGWWHGDKISSIEKIYERMDSMSASQVARNAPQGLLPAIVHWSWLQDARQEVCLDSLFARIDDCGI